jgi:phage host-nuclease inhibitor protein Gam
MKTQTINKDAGSITSTRFESAIATYAQAERREIEINKRIEAEVNELLEKYEDELACLAQSKGAAFEIAHTYCRENKETLFSTRRRISTNYGIAGFRLGNPRLKTTKGVSWDKALMALKEKLPAYVRLAEEPAKDMLLADRHKETVAPLLMQIGLEVVQDDLFYIETQKAA